MCIQTINRDPKEEIATEFFSSCLLCFVSDAVAFPNKGTPRKRL